MAMSRMLKSLWGSRNLSRSHRLLNAIHRVSGRIRGMKEDQEFIFEVLKINYVPRYTTNIYWMRCPPMRRHDHHTPWRNGILNSVEVE